MKIKTKNEYGWLVYELTLPEIEAMFSQALAVRPYTFPTTRGFSVAVLTKQGNVYPGVSYESDTHTLTMHSEAVALAHATTHGETEIVAITGPNCHTCKQLIWESSIRSMIDIVVVMEKNGQYEQLPISDMMPYAWPDFDGDKS